VNLQHKRCKGESTTDFIPIDPALQLRPGATAPYNHAVSRCLGLLLVVFSFGCHESGAATAQRSCIDCHRERQPGMLATWDAGAHAKANVRCEDCHGADHDAMFRAEGRVPAETCGQCHPKQTEEFLASVHGRARPDAVSNPLFLAQIPAVQRQACLGCHDTGAKGGRCDGCHLSHRFSVAEARRPEACGFCHCGPDHPQLESFELSKHGVVWAATQDAKQAPTCVTCHMTGTHDVSSGLTRGRAAHGAVPTGETPPVPMQTFDPARMARERETMLARCDACHMRRLSRRALDDADKIKQHADRLVAEGVRIVEGLYRDGLLDPMPETRIAHPTAGHTLAAAAAFENQSDPERLFFFLTQFAHSITFKAAYHQSPDYLQWHGIASLKSKLDELRALERRIRERGGD